MKIGFTGTRDGMTEEQIKVLLKCVMFDTQITEAHHGMCVGADVQFHDIIRKIDPNGFIKIIGHPASNFRHYKPMTGRLDVVREAKPSLRRNHDIVDECDILIATPKSEKEWLRSGTWSTVRYAHKINRDVVIINPDGGIVMHCKAVSELAAILEANRKTLEAI